MGFGASGLEIYLAVLHPGHEAPKRMGSNPIQWRSGFGVKSGCWMKLLEAPIKYVSLGQTYTVVGHYY